MGNLIESDDLGNWGVKGLPWKNLYVGNVITRAVHEKLYGCLCKLKDYEQTGLSPEHVEKLQCKNDWIPCSERLPEYSDDLLLVQCSGKPRVNVVLDNAIQLASYTEEGWIVEEYPEWEGAEVIAWQPLPEPYEAKQ